VLARAGRRALSRDDVPAAQSLLARATRLLPEHDRTRVELLCALGSALIRAGEFQRAETVLDEAIAAGSASGERTLELRAIIDRQHLGAFTDLQGVQRHIDAVAALLPELEELGDELNLAKAWWLLSEVHVDACRWGARAEALEIARSHARRAAEGPLEAMLISQLAQALLYGSTPVDEAIGRCEEFLAAARADRSLEAAILSTLGPLHAMRGDFEEGSRVCARAALIDNDLGLRFRRAARSLARAEVQLLAGDLDAAERELRWGYDTAAAIGAPGVRATIGAFLADALAEQGRLDEALELSRRTEKESGDDDIVTQAMWRCAQAKALARLGDAATALTLAREAESLAEATDFPNLHANALIAVAAALAAAGDTAEASVAAGRAVEIHERKGNRVAAQHAAVLVGDTVR
jgi:ATP/maltotriose-dependent transcriptional regulator MalT